MQDIDGIIGVECKYKKIIIKNDIDKFNRDLQKCQYKGAIFISFDGYIPGITS